MPSLRLRNCALIESVETDFCTRIERGGDTYCRHKKDAPEPDGIGAKHLNGVFNPRASKIPASIDPPAIDFPRGGKG